MNIEINGATLQGDFMDADFMELFEPALHEMQDGVVKVRSKQYGTIAAGYRDLNNCVESFFDKVWGDGTSERIFGGSKNVMVHLEAVSRIDTAFKAEKRQFNDFSNRYTQRQQQNSFNSMQGNQKKQKPLGHT